MSSESRRTSRGKRPAKAARKPAGAGLAPGARGEPRWSFLSSHAQVLICLAREPDDRVRDVAARVGITERAVQKILSDLEREGLVERHREGRRNTYALHLDQPLRHPIEAHREVGELVALILEG